MKFFWVIFAAYLMLLPVTAACADVCRDETPIGSHHHNEHDTDDSDNCSPFCACSCCGMVNHLPPSAVSAVIAAAAEPPVKWGHITARAIPFVYSDFWQPPRLG